MAQKKDQSLDYILMNEPSLIKQHRLFKLLTVI